MSRVNFAILLVLVVGFVRVDLVTAQQAESFKPGVVKLTAKVQGSTKVGTGIIVLLEKDAAYIVTAAHVVSGDSQPTVEFFKKRNVPLPADVLGVDENRGLAVLVVRGQENLPSGLIALPLASNIRLSGGETITLIGFPRSAGPWHVTIGNFGSRKGSDIYFSPTIDEGNSGGPIIQNGKVVGMVAGGLQSIGQGITVKSIEDYIDGFGITAQESTSRAPTAATPSPPPSAVTAKPESQPMIQAREITGKDGAPMVLVPAGEFTMGSRDDDKSAQDEERPAHQVHLDAYYIDQYEVTISRYATFFQQTNRAAPASWSEKVLEKHGRKPVAGVDWNDASAYCAWAGKRLPTEAEWEKAARGTDQRLYPWGNEERSSFFGLLGKRANFGHSGNFEDYGVLTDVGSYEAGKSPYGVYDMAGNVEEWTADWFDATYYSKSPDHNPPGPSTGEFRVLRGGSWDLAPVYVRSALRTWDSPSDRDVFFGFRCAQDAPK